MTQSPEPRDDGAVTTVPVPSVTVASGRLAWMRVAVIAAVVDTVAVAVTLVLTLDQDVFEGIRETGAWLNLIAAPAFPLLAALLFRYPDAGGQRSARRDRLAFLFLAFGVLCAATIVVHFTAEYALDHGLPA